MTLIYGWTTSLILTPAPLLTICQRKKKKRVSQQGTVQVILGNVSYEMGQRYDLLVKAPEERYAPPNQTECN